MFGFCGTCRNCTSCVTNRHFFCKVEGRPTQPNSICTSDSWSPSEEYLDLILDGLAQRRRDAAMKDIGEKREKAIYGGVDGPKTATEADGVTPTPKDETLMAVVERLGNLVTKLERIQEENFRIHRERSERMEFLEERHETDRAQIVAWTDFLKAMPASIPKSVEWVEKAKKAMAEFHDPRKDRVPSLRELHAGIMALQAELGIGSCRWEFEEKMITVRWTTRMKDDAFYIGRCFGILDLSMSKDIEGMMRKTGTQMREEHREKRGDS